MYKPEKGTRHIGKDTRMPLLGRAPNQGVWLTVRTGPAEIALVPPHFLKDGPNSWGSSAYNSRKGVLDE